jgi:DNA-binding response OmpR family regulator
MATKILVVDDEAHIRMLYAEELAEEGYEVVTAENGQGLLELIEQEKPQVVVLDIKMVDYNGLDLLQDIRNKHYDLPVILCSAYDTFKDDMKSIAADHYVVKSFDLSELKQKIGEVLA